MTKRDKTVGYNESGHPGSSQWLSPRGPYTGDGKTRRHFVDGIIKVVFKSGKPKK